MRAFEIELLDVVSVRDGRSFDAGGASLARALWPPTPWTVSGAVRAQFVRALGVDPAAYGGRGWVSGAQVPDEVRECVEVLGRPEDPPRFRIGPLLLTDHKGVRLPPPLDLLEVEGGERQVARLVPRRSDDLRRAGASWSGPHTDWVLFPPDEGRPGKKTPFRHLNSGQADEWLNGKVPGKVLSEEDPVVGESRIGIAIDPASGRVQEGMFYQRRAFSLREGFRLIVPLLEVPEGLNNILPKASGAGELGGDRHMVRFSLRENFEWPRPGEAKDGRAVLWFLSPVRPEDICNERLSEAAKADIRVLAVASGRPMPLGGWKMWRDANHPRPMRRYHPAGTCVYVEGSALALHGKSVAGDREERAAGFGVCLCGAWPR